MDGRVKVKDDAMRVTADGPLGANSVNQACAVPFRSQQGSIQFCLITSSAGRWLFPKGYVDPGDTCAETALKEALEEAGLHGRIAGEPLGSYQIVKSGDKLTVIALLMEVAQTDEVWKEALKRQRRWVSFEEARRLLSDSELFVLLDKAKRLVGQDS